MSTGGQSSGPSATLDIFESGGGKSDDSEVVLEGQMNSGTAGNIPGNLIHNIII